MQRMNEITIVLFLVVSERKGINIKLYAYYINVVENQEIAFFDDFVEKTAKKFS